MSQSADDLSALFADNPESLHVDGVGEVPVHYVADEHPSPVYPDERLRWADRVVWREVSGEVVVFDPRERSAHVLNPTAGLLWQCMDGAGSVGEVFADFADAFAVALAEVELDFVPVVAEWKRIALVAPTGTEARPVRSAGTSEHVLRYLVDPPND